MNGKHRNILEKAKLVLQHAFSPKFLLNKRNILNGLIVVVPVYITIWLLVWFWNVIAGTLHIVTIPVSAFFGWKLWMVDIIALFFVWQTVNVVGLTAGSKIQDKFDSVFSRIVPIFRTIKSVIVALLGEKSAFRHVVVFEFADSAGKHLKSGYLMGVTSNKELAVVYEPTLPNPTSGVQHYINTRYVYRINVTSEKFITNIISCGAVNAEAILEEYIRSRNFGSLYFESREPGFLEKTGIPVLCTTVLAF